MSILPNAVQKENFGIINFNNNDGNVIGRIDKNKFYIGIYIAGVLFVDGEELDYGMYNLYYQGSTLKVEDDEQGITYNCNESLSFEESNNIFLTSILNK